MAALKLTTLGPRAVWTGLKLITLGPCTCWSRCPRDNIAALKMITVHVHADQHVHGQCCSHDDIAALK
eukprot:3182517-Karenia_brevis.AAC.1